MDLATKNNERFVVNRRGEPAVDTEMPVSNKTSKVISDMAQTVPTKRSVLIPLPTDLSA